MKRLSFIFVLLALTIANGFCEKGYFSEFGTEFESGTQEQEDSTVDSLSQYYTFYKNSTFFKRVVDLNNDFELRLDNGVKNYTDYKLDNHFHTLSMNYLAQKSKIFALDLGIKYGEAINNDYKENSYYFYRVEPKLIAKLDTYQFYTSLGYQLKGFDYRGEKTKNLAGEELRKGGDTIADTSLNFGITKQFSENTCIKAGYSFKYLESEKDAITSNKTTHNAKIGFYWQR